MAVLLQSRRPPLWKPGVGAQLNQGHPLAGGLIFCALLTEMGQTLADLTGNIGTTGGGPSWVGSPIGSAINVVAGSSQYATFPTQSRYDLGTNAVTLEAWTNPPNSSQAGTILCCRRNGSPFNQYWMGITGSGPPSSGQALGGVLIDGATSSYASHSTGNVADGNWHHLVVVGTPNVSIKFYVDGLVVAGTSDSTAAIGAISPGQPIRIGSNNGSTYYTGAVALARAWNRALSAAEVQDLYVRPFAMVAPLPSQKWMGYAATSSVTVTRDVTTDSAISTTVTGDVTSTAAVSATATADVASTAAVSITQASDVTSGAVVTVTVSTDVTSGAVIQTTALADLTSTAVITATVFGDLTSDASITTTAPAGGTPSFLSLLGVGH